MKSSIYLSFLSILTLFSISNSSNAMELPPAAPSIHELFQLGYLDDWEDEAGPEKEKALIKQGIRLKFKKDPQAYQVFLEAAQRASIKAMIELSHASFSNKPQSEDWLRLAMLINYQKTGQRHELIDHFFVEKKSKPMPFLSKAPLEKLLPNKPPEIIQAPGEKWDPQIHQFNTAMESQFAFLQDTLTQMQGVRQMLSQLLQSQNSSLDEMERRELVKKEIALWLKNEPLLAQRVQAFILLSCPVSSDLADFALALTDEEKLPKIEAHLFLEKLLRKYKRHHNGKNTDINDLLENTLIKIMPLLYEANPNGLYGIKDRYAKMLNLCEEVDKPYFWAWRAILMSDETVPFDLSPEMRQLEAGKWLEKARISADKDTLIILGISYLDGTLGKELASATRFEIAINYFNKCGYSKEIIAKFMSKKMNQEIINYVQYLMTTDFADKAILYFLVAAGNINFYNDQFIKSLADPKAEIDLRYLERAADNAKIALSLGLNGQYESLALTMISFIPSSEPAPAAEAESTDSDSINSSDNEGQEIVPEKLNEDGDIASKERPLKVNKKERKIAKKALKARLLAEELRKLMNSEAKSTPAPEIRIEFADATVRRQFESLAGNSKKKVKELFDDIMLKPWGLQGTGSPEVLKHQGKYGGMISRHINKGDRLVYEYIGNNTVRIHSCVGHYE